MRYGWGNQRALASLLSPKCPAQMLKYPRKGPVPTGLAKMRNWVRIPLITGLRTLPHRLAKADAGQSPWLGSASAQAAAVGSWKNGRERG